MESVDRSSAPRVQLNVRLRSTAERSHRLSSHVTKSLDSPGRFRILQNLLVEKSLSATQFENLQSSSVVGVVNHRSCTN
jgi:hypothetical protein